LLRTKGSIYSSPIIFKNKIVFALCEENSNNTYLVYYDFLNSVERASILIDGLVLNQMIKDKDDIILCTENGKILKYGSDGRLIWEIDSKTKIQSNPALIGNKILIGNINGEIIFVDSEGGKLIQSNKIGGSFFSGVTIDDKIAFIGDDNGTLFAIDVNDGKIIWEYKTGYRILMNPAVDDEFVYIGNLKGDLYAFNKINGKLVWKSEIDGVLNSTPIISKNRVVINNLLRSFFIIDKKDGEIKKKIELDGRGKLSPILINNKIIIGFDDGNLSAYEIVY
jgi:outer membrane protein assembly factor BamB